MCAVAFEADGQVSLFGAELNGGAIEGGFAIDMFEVHDRLAIAVVASGFHFFDGIGNFHEAEGAGEEFGAKISSESVTNHGDRFF